MENRSIVNWTCDAHPFPVQQKKELVIKPSRDGKGFDLQRLSHAPNLQGFFEQLLRDVDETVSNTETILEHDNNADISDMTPLWSGSNEASQHSLMQLADEVISIFGCSDSISQNENSPSNFKSGDEEDFSHKPTQLLTCSPFDSRKDVEKERLLDCILQQPESKKMKTSPPEDDSAIRGYQAEQWSQRFDELREYVDSHGHSQVPHSFAHNPALARWVKRQRYQYKLRMEEKKSTMTDERVSALEAIGFVWDSHLNAWDERYDDLIEYKMEYGHCNVPSNYAPNKQLAVWVKRQRRQYKFWINKRQSSMTKPRIVALEAIGFEWELRQYKDQRK